MNFSNTEIAKKLREVAAAYTLKKSNFFQVRAYEGAADSIERSTSEVKDLWEENNLDQIPGMGESLKEHLTELFKTGKVTHWEDVKKGIPKEVFEFLDIPGVGPKTALKFSNLGVTSIVDLKTKLESGLLTRKGFSEKIGFKILSSLNRARSEGRMLLPYAFTQAERVLEYLKDCPDIESANVLGSLRRMVATIGDLDFSIASYRPQKVVDYLLKMPGLEQVLDKGEEKVTLINSTGLRLDFIITSPKTYGALLQHFTGSKQHNIQLRILAAKKGLSLSEHGIKEVNNGKVQETKTEEEFYKYLGMDTPVPETREDSGEIEAALKHNLPQLIELKDIKGDLHLHDNYPIEPSHDLGLDNLKDLAEAGKRLGYQFIGIADHSPSISNHSKEDIIKLLMKRKEYIEKYNYSSTNIRVLNLLEVDILPDGLLAVPDDGLELLDFVIASTHSIHNMPKDKMTERILTALKNPYVKVLGHPTNRLINKREESDVDWEEIFKFAAKNNKAMEINSFPDRLDLPDNLVRMAKSYGVKFVINTDSHEIPSLINMKFGVAVARRGWLGVSDVVNAWDWTEFKEWFNIKL